MDLRVGLAPYFAYTYYSLDRKVLTVEQSIQMEQPSRGDENTSPRLLDTSMCPLSTTKKSIARTYNNESLFIASMERDCQQSIIDECRAKLKLRKAILELSPESIKESTKRLLSRVGQYEDVLEPLLKFQKSVSVVISKLQDQVRNAAQENSNPRSGTTLPKTQITTVLPSNYRQLQLKVQRLQATIKHLIEDETPLEIQAKRETSMARSSQQGLSEVQKSTLAMALAELAKLQKQKGSHAYVVNNLRMEISRMREECKQDMVQSSHIDLLSEDLQRLKMQNQQLRRYRQMFYMCREEKQALQMSTSLDSIRAKQSQKQVRKLKQKLMNLSSLIGKGDFGLVDNEEKDSIQKIKDELISHEGFRRCTEQQFRMLEKYECDLSMQPSIQSRYQQKLKIYYPTFFSLLTEEVKEFEIELKLSLNKAVTSDLFVRIRAILDSRYNYSTVQDNDSIRFPDFVFGWFEKFEVDTLTRRIVQHSKPRVECQFNRKNFLVSLFNPKISKLNQMITFREFLLKQTPEDQIYYYLQCRGLLFRGSQLDHFGNASDTVTFLQYDHVIKQVGLLINKYSKDVQNIILYNVNLRRKKKFNNYFVDSSFVLRTLLEVYRAYKRQKYDKMKLVVMKLQNTLGCSQLKFIYFRELVELNFPKLSVDKVSFMYRQALNVFKANKIDFFGAFYAVSHQTLFKYTIKEDLFNIQLSQQFDSRTLVTISATLPSTLGLECLNQQLTQMFGNSLPDIFAQNLLLNKLLKLLIGKADNKDYVQRLKEKLRAENDSKLTDVRILTENMMNQDLNIKKAATKLTRAFRWRIKIYYDKLIDRINQKIDQANKTK